MTKEGGQEEKEGWKGEREITDQVKKREKREKWSGKK